MILLARTGILQTAEALLFGGVGAAAAWSVNAPAPYLVGPAVAVTVVALGGRRLRIADPLRDLCFIVIGLSLSQGITPEVVAQARQWPLTFAMLGIALVATLYLCARLLSAVWKHDRTTGLLASSPGHLSYVLGLSADTRADIRTVSIVQSVRLLALTLLVPLLAQLFGVSEPVSLAAPREIPLIDLLLIAAGAAMLGGALKRLAIPAALLLGGMIVSTFVHGTGVVEGHMPAWAMIPAFVIMGTLIGTRFSGVSLAMLRGGLAAGLAVTAVAILLAAAAAMLAAGLTDIPLTTLLVAFAPGGVETMAAIAVLTGADPTFVAAHHVARLFFLSVLLPVALGRGRT